MESATKWSGLWRNVEYMFSRFVTVPERDRHAETYDTIWRSITLCRYFFYRSPPKNKNVKKKLNQKRRWYNYICHSVSYNVALSARPHYVLHPVRLSVRPSVPTISGNRKSLVVSFLSLIMVPLWHTCNICVWWTDGQTDRVPQHSVRYTHVPRAVKYKNHDTGSCTEYTQLRYHLSTSCFLQTDKIICCTFRPTLYCCHH